MDAITKIGVRRRYGSLSNYFGQMLSNQKYFSANGKGPAIVTRLVLAPEWSGGHNRRHRVQGLRVMAERRWLSTVNWPSVRDTRTTDQSRWRRAVLFHRFEPSITDDVHGNSYLSSVRGNADSTEWCIALINHGSTSVRRLIAWWLQCSRFPLVTRQRDSSRQWSGMEPGFAGGGCSWVGAGSPI